MRPQPRVHLAVPAKAAGVFEGLSALLTHVRPLARVLSQMVLVMRAPLEGQRAMWALERPHACMHLEWEFTVVIAVSIFGGSRNPGPATITCMCSDELDDPPAMNSSNHQTDEGIMGVEGDPCYSSVGRLPSGGWRGARTS